MMGDAHVTVETTASELTFYPGNAMAWQALQGLTYASAADLAVYTLASDGSAAAVLLRDVDYALGGNGETGNGQIRALTARDPAERWLVTRETPPTQKREFPAHKPIQSESLSKSLDRLTLIVQELLATARRAVRVPLGETGLVLPGKAARAGKYQAYDANGDPVLSTGTGADAGLRGDLALSTDALFADATFARQYPTVEAAYTTALAQGKKRVIVNGIAWVANGTVTTFNLPIVFRGGASINPNGNTITLAGGFIAEDRDAVFAASDVLAGRIVVPDWQQVTAWHCGAKGDYVSAAQPGTDDGNALQAWASLPCERKRTRGRFGTRRTIHWNGNAGGAANVNLGMQGDAGMRIIQVTDNIPIMTVWGSRGVWELPMLEYANRQASDSYSAVGVLVTPPPGQTGWYQNVIGRIMVRNGANVGFFNPPAFASTTTAGYAAGVTAITVANAQTDATGSYPWVPGLWVQVALAAGGLHISRLAGVAGAVLTLETPLPGAVNNGAAVSVSGETPPTSFPSAIFSNTIHSVVIDAPSRYGFVDRGTGTGDFIGNLYVRAPGSGDVATPTYTIEQAVYISGKTAQGIAQFNVEYLGFNREAVFVSGRHFKFGEVHFEGARLYANNTSLFAGTAPDLDIDLMQVEYWRVDPADIANGVAIFGPRAVPGTTLGGGRGQWRVRQLNTRKNVFSRADTNGRAFIAGYFTGSTVTQIKIESWRYDRDGGFYPSGQLVTPSSKGGLVALGNLLPPDCVAYAFNVDASVDSAANYQRIFTSIKGQFKIREVLAMHPSVSMTTAAGGIYADVTGTTLVSNVSNQGLATLTDSGKVLSIPLAAAEATVLRTGASDLSYKSSATQAKPAPLTGTSSYLTGRNGGDNNTNLAFINFAAPHGLTAGNTVLITGSVTAALNGIKRKIVDVPSATQIVVYCDSAAPVGTAGAPTADAAISVQHIPTFDLVVLGADLGNFDAF